MEYMHHPNIEVILIGDKVSKSAKLTVGGEAISKIKQVRADICFLGINAINLETGVTDNDWDVVQIKKTMIESAQKTVCLSISEKINSFQPIKVCDITEIHTLITELSPDDAMLEKYREAGLEVL